MSTTAWIFTIVTAVVLILGGLGFYISKVKQGKD